MWGTVKSFFTGMGKKTRVLLAVVLGAITVIGIISALVVANRPYTVLFTDLASEEARAIVGYLDENGITDYRLVGSNTIEVPENLEASLKARLLMEGYPKSGFSYSTYRSAIGTMATESDRNIAYMQDLQDRMSATIRCFDGVKDAVVTIAAGDDQRYILNNNNITKAQASVLVTMNGGTKLTSQQASAIRNLIARAVKGLEMSNIAIADSIGNTYSSDTLSSSSEDASMLKLQLEEEISNSTRTEIMTVLAPFFGEDNIRVAVYAEVDVRHTVGESTKYSEPETWPQDGSTEGRGIIGQEIYDQEIVRGGENAAGGVVGAQTNSDIPSYVEQNLQADGNTTYAKNQGETNYNVNTDKEQVERYAAVVSNLMVSVSINSAANSGVNTQNLTELVARASGITNDLQDDKISIHVAPFYTAPESGIGVLPGGNLLPIPDWALYAAIGGVALLLILLIVIGRLRKRKRNKKKERELDTLLTGYEQIHQPVMPTGADIMNLKTERSMELRKDIRQFAEENPEIAAVMLKTWLKGGEAANG
ncbi:MAG: fliF [Firmicutes bacterium]|nr:fliF [Bacillota bacterium]